MVAVNANLIRLNSGRERSEGGARERGKKKLLLTALKNSNIIELIVSERNQTLTKEAKMVSLLHCWLCSSITDTVLAAYFDSMKHMVYLMVLDPEIVD